MRSVDLLFSLDEFVFLIGEVDELIEGLLVHVTVFLQLSVALVQLLEQLRIKMQNKLSAHSGKYTAKAQQKISCDYFTFSLEPMNACGIQLCQLSQIRKANLLGAEILILFERVAWQ